jgi:hypothetical protein
MQQEPTEQPTAEQPTPPLSNIQAKADHLKEELKRGLNLLRMLRDEIRVRLHLGGLDAKGEWNRLEPHLIDVERAAHTATEASRRMIADAIERLKRLRASL